MLKLKYLVDSLLSRNPSQKHQDQFFFVIILGGGGGGAGSGNHWGQTTFNYVDMVLYYKWPTTAIITSVCLL